VLIPGGVAMVVPTPGPIAGISDLRAPTARNVTLFVNNVPDIAAWDTEFYQDSCACPKTSLYPDRAARITALINYDRWLPPSSREAALLLLHYYQSYGLAHSSCNLTMLILMAIMAVPLIALGWFVTWPAFVLGIIFVIYVPFGFWKHCSQKGNADVERARILQLIMQANTEAAYGGPPS
jgi:hypothetical protein